jgi:hypothetical protein
VQVPITVNEAALAEYGFEAGELNVMSSSEEVGLPLMLAASEDAEVDLPLEPEDLDLHPAPVVNNRSKLKIMSFFERVTSLNIQSLTLTFREKKPLSLIILST